MKQRISPRGKFGESKDLHERGAPLKFHMKHAEERRKADVHKNTPAGKMISRPQGRHSQNSSTVCPHPHTGVSRETERRKVAPRKASRRFSESARKCGAKLIHIFPTSKRNEKRFPFQEASGKLSEGNANLGDKSGFKCGANGNLPSSAKPSRREFRRDAHSKTRCASPKGRCST